MTTSSSIRTPFSIPRRRNLYQNLISPVFFRYGRSPLMSLFDDIMDSRLFLSRFRDGFRHFSASVSASVTAASCGGEKTAADDCRDDAAALRLKLAAVAAILMAGVAGVAIPLAGRKRRLRTDGVPFVLSKAFAAGVILATGFVHMLHDAQAALTSPCLPASPWRSFPFPGFVAMLAALGTMVADFLATQFYERKHREEAMGVKAAAAAAAAAALVASAEEDRLGITVVSVAPEPEEVEEESNGTIHIVGLHSHVAPHRHSHTHVQGTDGGGGAGHGHARDVEEGEVSSLVRHVVASQILEFGIVSHSVIIGLSLGVSRSPCTIRPLVAALSFHQFFEGFALGGCISQAQLKSLSAALMACFFAVTTPGGIAAGAGMAAFYDANSPRALVVEGLLDSVSAGILIYMALVDLIAAEFLSGRMSGSVRLQAASYLALFLGALSMSSLAVWA